MPLQSIKKTYEILAGLKRHTTVFMGDAANLLI